MIRISLRQTYDRIANLGLRRFGVRREIADERQGLRTIERVELHCFRPRQPAHLARAGSGEDEREYAPRSPCHQE